MEGSKMSTQKVLIELTVREQEELIQSLEVLQKMCKIIGKLEEYHVATKLLEKLKKRGNYKNED